jgi:hypothetical protein
MARLRVVDIAGIGPLAGFNEYQARVVNVYLGTVSTAENAVPLAQETVCLLSANQDIWYKYGGTAAAPTSDVTSGGSIYLPVGERRFLLIDDPTILAISVVSPVVNTSVTALFWTE